jgi:hypothetical protein
MGGSCTCRVKRVEGRRDEIPTIKANCSPRNAAKIKENPAGMTRRGLVTGSRCRYLFKRLA